eukprot:11264659-Ditylum_brightwellii.AAC.1
MVHNAAQTTDGGDGVFHEGFYLGEQVEEKDGRTLTTRNNKEKAEKKKKKNSRKKRIQMENR